MSALESHKRSAQWTKDNGQYIPTPVTRIDQMRWEDELPQAQNASESNSSFDTNEFVEAAYARTVAMSKNLKQNERSDET